MNHAILLLLVLSGSASFVDGFHIHVPCRGRQPLKEPIHRIQLGDAEKTIESFVTETLFSFVRNDKDAVEEVDPRQELWAFPSLETASEKGKLDIARESLMNYLQLWARQLQDDPKGLTTPVVAQGFRNCNVTENIEGSTGGSTGTILEAATADYQYASMKLIFRPPKRYLSYKEQRDMEKGVLPDRKGAKVDAWSPGGVELIVKMIPLGSSNDLTSAAPIPTWRLQLECRRCDIDADTIIKYSSERAIVRRLKEAVRIWEKVRAMRC
ncbi:expressed unknown protein [Seminavis robusta]|uniref:Uncharacterized protein n=1 Tax=Seminavis robusta TaxID=568900 RepID=A0A9N8EKP8_9STRA|nr:expressed unknown protein [Seminavis robusta]|eukprot:Sro1269_g257900.1 n/a (268) ;mRNA; r:25861-26664